MASGNSANGFLVRIGSPWDNSWIDPHVISNIVTATTTGHRFISGIAPLRGFVAIATYFCQQATTAQQQQKGNYKDKPARKGMIEAFRSLRSPVIRQDSGTADPKGIR